VILLDTDHLTVLRYADDPRCHVLTKKLTVNSDRRVATTVVTLEEQLRGWLAAISRHRDIRRQIPAYNRLAELIEFFQEWEIVGFDEAAAHVFEELRRKRVRIGSQDMKIASIALSRRACLLSANVRDFRLVPELRVENWLTPVDEGAL
jgi:tRNA(fMet)-specific endonuclease VapC